MYKLSGLSLTILVFCVVACGREDTVTTLTDADLKHEIETSINSDPELGAADLSISADAKRRTVTISGTVESEALRSKAVDSIRTAHAGLTVEDLLTVKPRELSRAEYTAEHARQERIKARERKDRIGNSTDDAWIHAAIVASFMADASTPEQSINVDVRNGVVTLRGSVSSANQKSGAERIAKGIQAVTRVNNLLRVPRARPDDGVDRP